MFSSRAPLFNRKILFNTILGIVLIWGWTRFVNLEEIWVTLRGVKIEYSLGFFLLFTGSSILRSLRLKLLLSRFNFRLKDLILLNFLSQFLSFMIPIRAGEITKGVYLSTHVKEGLPKTLVWVFIDRFLDFWVLLVLSAGSLLLLPVLPQRSVYLLLAGILLISVVTIFSIIYLEFAKKMVHFLSNYLIIKSLKRYFVSLSISILEGFEILKVNPLGLLKLLGLTTGAYILDGLWWYLIFLALGLNLGFLKPFLGNMLMALTFLLPAAPGFVGSAEASGLLVWGGILGLESNLASSGTVLFHILTVVVLLIFGLSGIYLLKFDLNLVWKRFRVEIKN